MSRSAPTVPPTWDASDPITRILMAVSSAIVDRTDVDAAIDGAVEACFIAARVSSGALCLMGDDGNVRTRQIGVSADPASAQREELERAVTMNECSLLVGSTDARLLVPLVEGEARLGVLVVSGPTDRLSTDPQIAWFRAVAAQITLALSLGRSFERKRQAEESARTALARWQELETQLLLSDRMASVGLMAAGVAHEINNPLAAVLTNLELAQEDALALGSQLGASELPDLLREAREAAEHVRQIVRDLKIFCRSEEDATGPVDVRKLLESTLRMARNEIRHRARLTLDLVDVPPVNGNESRLAQVFLNLVVNAAQAIPEGRRDSNEIRVTTSKRADGRVAIEVADTGPGMPSEVLANLFAPFFTTKPKGLGTGLGLSICHRIVISLGGEITATSEVGKGSVFTVVLPTAVSKPRREASKSGVTTPATPRGRILVIDDDAMNGSSVRRALMSLHDVFLETSARAALTRLEAGEQFDVILCDLMMPDVTGMELHAHVESTMPNLASLFIFMTGGVFTARGREFLDTVPNLRVDKPFEAQQLRALVNDRVRSAALRQHGSLEDVRAKEAVDGGVPRNFTSGVRVVS